MEFEVIKSFKIKGGIYKIGDVVTIKFLNGGGCGGCEITKITDTGFMFRQGTSREKNVQFKNLENVY